MRLRLLLVLFLAFSLLADAKESKARALLRERLARLKAMVGGAENGFSFNEGKK